MNIESSQGTTCAEMALYDVTNVIFKYLNIYDLNQASKVCKWWYHAAKSERAKRGPQVMILQALEDLVATGFSDVRIAVKNVNVQDFKSTLRIKPKIGLFFTDGKYPAAADCDSVPFEICNAHQWTQPECSFYLAIEALGVNVNDDAIGGEKNITAAVFLPDLPTANYVVVEASSNQIERYNRANADFSLDEITNGLFEKDENHACFVIFMYQWKDEPSYKNHHNKFLLQILDNLKSRYETGTFSLWGAAVSDIFAMSADCARPLHHSTSFCALKISGTRVDSWSIVLGIEWPVERIVAELQNFKTRVRLKSSSLALLILPTAGDKDDNSLKTKVFQSVFPNVDTISIFNDKNHIVLSVNSTDCGEHQEMKHSNCYAYLIITYK